MPSVSWGHQRKINTKVGCKNTCFNGQVIWKAAEVSLCSVAKTWHFNSFDYGGLIRDIQSLTVISKTKKKTCLSTKKPVFGFQDCFRLRSFDCRGQPFHSLLQQLSIISRETSSLLNQRQTFCQIVPQKNGTSNEYRKFAASHISFVLHGRPHQWRTEETLSNRSGWRHCQWKGKYSGAWIANISIAETTE